jgi:hypothetical protein
MTSFIQRKMKEMNIDALIKDKAVKVLPYLKRWRAAEVKACIFFVCVFQK